MEIKRAASKINSTLLKTKTKKTINYRGQPFVSPGRDFHSSNTPETLRKKEKTVNNRKFKKSCLTKKQKTINHRGQRFVSPGRDIHSSNTPETLRKKEKTVNNRKFKKILFNIIFLGKKKILGSGLVLPLCCHYLPLPVITIAVAIEVWHFPSCHGVFFHAVAFSFMP